MKFLSPRMRWNALRILPFGVIYLITTWVFMVIELAVHGSSESNDYLVITPNLPVVLFVTITTFLVGILVGMVEMLLLQQLFKDRPLFQKIFYKMICYIIGGFLIVLLAFPIAASLEVGLPIWHNDILGMLVDFLQSITFYSTILQMSFTVLLCLIYGAIAENLGHDVLTNFFTGKYHNPKAEERIFMFLDMKDSTSIAEALGHEQYFKLLQVYYDLMSDPIIDMRGEVYQYIGDEVVITWKKREGILANNCIKCFYAIKDNVNKNRDLFQTKFRVSPDFRAGVHLGVVTTGEVGALKKEIVYTGDVLNTAARIQAKCRTFQSDLIVSGDLLQCLEKPHLLKIKKIGDIDLKGKKKSVELFSIEK